MATKHTDTCFHKAEDDEPIFVLLGRDPLAPELVRSWAQGRINMDIDVEENAEKIVDAYAIAKEMEKWREKNRPGGE